MKIGLPHPIRTQRDGARFRALCKTADYEAALVYYPRRVEHPAHEHTMAQLTFLLCGGFADSWEGRETEPSGARHGFRPEGARHSCRFGADGALILSVNVRPGVALPKIDYGWRSAGRRMIGLYHGLFAAGSRADEAVDDIIAAASLGEAAEQHRPSTAAPGWLRAAIDELADQPCVDIAGVAARAGLHRVYFSRAFQKHLGMSPSQFRLQCKATRAVRYLVENGESPAEAASAAGFADQAHLTRASRHLLGIAPGRLKTILTA